MFSKLVKTSVPSNFIIIPVIILTGWWSFILGIEHVTWSNNKSILLSVLPPEIFTFPWGSVISVAMVMVVALIMIPFTARYFYSITGNVLPSVFFIALSSQIMWISVQGASLIAIFLFLFIFRNLFEVYHKNRVFGFVFNAGFLSGLSVLIYFPSVLFLIVCWAGIILLRPFSFREFFTALTGAIIPLIFTHALFMILGHEPKLYNLIENNFITTPFIFNDIRQIIWISFLAIFVFWSIVKVMLSGTLKKIVIRRYFETFLVTIILFSIVLISPYSDNGIFAMLLIPISYIISISVASIRKIFYADIIILLMILMQIFVQLPYFR